MSASESEDDLPLARRTVPAAATAQAGPSGPAAAPQNGGLPKPAAPAAAANGAAKPAAHLVQGRQVVSDSDSEDEVPLAARSAAVAAAAAKPAAPAAAKPAAPAAAKPAGPKPAAAAAPKPAAPKRPGGLFDDAVQLPAAPRPKAKAPAPPVAPKPTAVAAGLESDSDEDQPLAARKAKMTPGGRQLGSVGWW
jgi:hypothetical protein